MSDIYDYSNTIAKAASRARGGRLDPLRNLCEGQKTVSTRKLSRLIDELHEDDKLDAIHFRVLADRLNTKEQ